MKKFSLSVQVMCYHLKTSPLWVRLWISPISLEMAPEWSIFQVPSFLRNWTATDSLVLCIPPFTPSLHCNSTLLRLWDVPSQIMDFHVAGAGDFLWKGSDHRENLSAEAAAINTVCKPRWRLWNYFVSELRQSASQNLSKKNVALLTAPSFLERFCEANWCNSETK